MNKDLFKKAMAFVDAVRVKIGLIVTTSLITLVYGMIEESKTENGIYSDFMGDIKFLLEEKFEQMIDVTIDTLDHFDDLFNSGFHHTEVYLGRDGIFAYMARRAQLWARRKAGFKVPRIIYLVYNSHMRDTLTQEQALPYLAQFGLTPDNQDGVLYYDTGFSGSIPKKIMAHLGLTESESIRKYKMVSYSHDPSDFRNIALPVVSGKYRANHWSDMSMRDHFCILLENLPKSEESAYGIRISKDGRITHHTSRFTGDAARKFKLIRKVLVQYFYNREKDSLNTNRAGHFKHSRFPSMKQEVVVTKYCNLCDSHYDPQLDDKHGIKCYDCYDNYCGDDHHICCPLCGVWHCVNSGNHNDTCDRCGISYCQGGHYTFYCNDHDKYYCDSDWGGSECSCLVANNTIDTSLALVFATDMKSIKLT